MSDQTTAPSRYIVQTAAAAQKRSWQWRHPRRRVAVMEIESGAQPRMISARARGVRQVVRTWECCYVGRTAACQYARALRAAERLAADLDCATLLAL